MFKKALFLAFSVVLVHPPVGLTCESCMISRIGKDGGARLESADKKWFAEYLFEQKNYDRMDAKEAHTLHHQGHDVHDKTTEDFHHLTLGVNVTDDVAMSVELPYIIRRFLEVDTHSILGNKQRSEGLGDLTLTTNWRFWTSGAQSLGAVGGVKFPTGYTGEKNTIGAKFEPEMQPGSGSFDYILGGVYKTQLDRVALTGNMSYVINTPGAYEFKFGNMLTTSAYLDYALNPAWKEWKTKTGIDLVYQYEQKEKQYGNLKADSGGHRLLTGPSLNVDVWGSSSVYGSLLFPAYQRLGGVHQELDYTWTMGYRLQW